MPQGKRSKRPSYINRIHPQFRHLTKLSENRLAQIYGGRLREQIHGFQKEHGVTDESAAMETLSAHPKDIIADAFSQSVVSNKPVKEVLIDAIRKQSQGEVLGGLRFVTTKEMPLSVRKLSVLDENQIAKIIVKRLTLARKLSPQMFAGSKPTIKAVLEHAKYNSKSFGVPVKKVLLAWFFDSSRADGVTKDQVMRAIIKHGRISSNIHKGKK